jgi:predicted transglutaminase-like cysteine proteinase
MRLFVRLIAHVAMVIFCATMSAAPAAAANSAPLGYQLLCLKSPEECRGGGVSQIPATPETLELIKRVNAAVNGQIAPTSDGDADIWNASATSSGDCEDYVLAKRKALIRAGLPPSALRIAYVETADGIGHAVLVVVTTEGNLALDNLRGGIRSLAQTGYRIISMSGADPRQWS